MNLSQDDTKMIVNEIKVLLQEELSEVKNSMHNLEKELISLKGRSTSRTELKTEFEAERDKREILEAKHNKLDKEVTELKASLKIYIGIAAGVSAFVSSVLLALISFLIT